MPTWKEVLDMGKDEMIKQVSDLKSSVSSESFNYSTEDLQTQIARFKNRKQRPEDVEAMINDAKTFVGGKNDK